VFTLTGCSGGRRGAAAQTIYLQGLNYTQTAGNDTTLVNMINDQLKGATASVSGAHVLTFTAAAAGAGAGGGIVIGGSAAGALDGGGNWNTGLVTGADGNNQLLISTNVAGYTTPATITIGNGNYDNGASHTDIVATLNAQLLAQGLQNAGGTAGVIASLNGSGQVTFTTSSLGAGSWVSVAAPAAGVASSALGTLGITAATHIGTDSSAANILSQIQSATKEAVEAIRNYLLAAKFQTRMASVIANAVDELLMNAIFDAVPELIGGAGSAAALPLGAGSPDD